MAIVIQLMDTSQIQGVFLRTYICVGVVIFTLCVHACMKDIFKIGITEKSAILSDMKNSIGVSPPIIKVIFES